MSLKPIKLGSNHPRNMVRVMSDCCHSTVNYIPPCFGDPAIQICSNCSKHCNIIEKPAFEMVSPGTWREIDYSIDRENLLDKEKKSE